MVARIWHGKTSADDYEAYTKLLEQIAIPGYKETKGFEGLLFLRNIIGNEGHFKLITYWENYEVIKNFAGQNIENARYYPEDKNFLLEFEEKVQHYEIFAKL